MRNELRKAFFERMAKRTKKKSEAAKMPESRGEMNHERTTPKKPPGSGLSGGLGSFHHVTDWPPREAMAMPIIPPTHECVVDTGISRRHAVTSQRETEKMVQKQPYMRSGGLSTK